MAENITVGLITYEPVNTERCYAHSCDSSASGVLEIERQVEFSDGKTRNVVKVSNNFCRENLNITKVIFPNTIEDIGNYAFYKCENLSEINMPDSIKHISQYAFAYCKRLSEINMPNSITIVSQYAFMYCSNLTSVVLSDNLNNVSIGCFGACTMLKEVKLPKNLLSIHSQAFYNCERLEEISIPNGCTDIEKECFMGCINLKHISIPQSVKTIGNSCFSGCSNLEHIFFYDTITSLSNNLFYKSGLVNFTVSSSITKIGSKAFYNCNNCIWIKIECDESLVTDDTYIKVGRHREEYPIGVFWVKDGYSMAGIIPNVPANLRYTSGVKFQGDTQHITWESNGNPEETLYDLYLYQNSQWVLVTETNGLSYDHILPVMEEQKGCKYKIRANLNYLYSDWCESDITFDISKLVTGIKISGEDEYLGEKTESFTIEYYVVLD